MLKILAAQTWRVGEPDHQQPREQAVAVEHKTSGIVAK